MSADCFFVRTDAGFELGSIVPDRDYATVDLRELPLKISKTEGERLINALAAAFDIPLEIRGGWVVSGVTER